MEIFAKLLERFLVFVYHCFDRIVIQGLGLILDVAIERVDRTVDAPKRHGLQAGRAHARRIYKDDALGDGFVGRAKAIGRFDDHNLAVQWLDTVATEQFGIHGHGGALGDKHAHRADFEHHGLAHAGFDAGVIAAGAGGPAAVGNQAHVSGDPHRLGIPSVEFTADGQRDGRAHSGRRKLNIEGSGATAWFWLSSGTWESRGAHL